MKNKKNYVNPWLHLPEESYCECLALISKEKQSNFGRSLRRLRQAKGLKQEDLAKMLGVSRQIISGYESGKKSPSFLNIIKLQSALRCSLEAFISDSPFETESYQEHTEDQPEFLRIRYLGIIRDHLTALRTKGLPIVGEKLEALDYFIFSVEKLFDEQSLKKDTMGKCFHIGDESKGGKSSKSTVAERLQMPRFVSLIQREKKCGRTRAIEILAGFFGVDSRTIRRLLPKPAKYLR